MYKLFRFFLFLLPAETSHDLSLKALRFYGRCNLLKPFHATPIQNPKTVMGILFENPVGLAAGLDKNASAIDGLGALGFGFIEVGTVTPKPQSGNPKPRLFRIKPAQAIVNRMGFNNEGVEAFVKNVRQAHYGGVIGLNIGKNAVTPVESALEDYVTCLEAVYPHADYVTVNISSPNTKNLRELQHGQALDELLAGIKSKQAALAEAQGRYVPVVVKVAPDLEPCEVVDIAEALKKHKVDGLVATNTSLKRDGVDGMKHAQEQGGLSGSVIFKQSTEILKSFRAALGADFPIIAAGGISSGEDAVKKMEAGANLIQVYSGFVYQGPALISAVNQALLNYEK